MNQESLLRIFTWHIHGSYLYYLSKCNIEIYVPFNVQRSNRYIGLGTTFPFGENVKEIAAEEVKNVSFDCIVFQSPENYQADQHHILSEKQRTLPRLYIEHNPPQENPVYNRHVVEDPEVTIVHVTHFNNLMWDNNGVPSVVVDHGIAEPAARYTGELPRGIVVINNCHSEAGDWAATFLTPCVNACRSISWAWVRKTWAAWGKYFTHSCRSF